MVIERVAVIDLGTNTFNILIAEKELTGQIHYIFRTQEPVFLGQNGINRNIITNEAINRALNVLEKYKNIALQHNVQKILAFGTSALRTAQNADEIIKPALEKFDIPIEIITGQREAHLIYLGIRHSLPPINEPFLIVDIGGGSNELIISDTHKIYWKKSYPIGMARILEYFHFSDPINNEEILSLKNYFEKKLSDFFQIAPQYGIKYLIGAEGAFESFLHFANNYGLLNDNEKQTLAQKIPHNYFKNVYQSLINSTLNERQNMKGLSPFRAEMIVPAIIFTHLIMEKLHWPQLLVSTNSLKEGAAWEYFNDKNKP